MKNMSLLGLLGFFLVFSCTKDPKAYPPEPQIYYQSVKPAVIDLSAENQSVDIIFSFTDGDGDIAQDQTETEPAIYVRRQRDTLAAPYAFPMPFIPENVRPEKGGVEGRVVINLGKEFFSIDSLHSVWGGDTVAFDIYIKDLTGNRSNVITTDSVIVTF